MAPLPSRKSLEAMKRADLQKLCKDYGVKANLKSEALIDLLLDTTNPVIPNAPTRRSVSTRHSSRAGPSRTTSIVIHDTDDEGEGEQEHMNGKHTPNGGESDNQSSSQAEPTYPPVTRTRKGKEQTRLGVGRPAAAGGSGPRTVTKSISISKGKRGKVSKSMKPTEATIVEEAEPESTQDEPDEGLASQADHQQVPTKRVAPEASIESLAAIDKRVADALRPLHDQIKSMKSELELMQALKTEVGVLTAQVIEIGSLREKVEALTTTVRDLRREADEYAAMRVQSNQPKESPTTQLAPSTPEPPTSPFENRVGPMDFANTPSPSETRLRQESGGSGSPGPSTPAANSARPHPDIAPTMLGKRHRDSTTSDVGGANQGDDIKVGDSALEAAKPIRKRAKLFQEGDPATEQNSPQEDGSGEAVVQDEENAAQPAPAPRAPSFTVFTGHDEPPLELMDLPPPTESLPDFFAPPSSPPGSETSQLPRQGSTTTSTARAAENQQPFAFTFQPMTSTPAHGMFMPSFPYPEPPQSPSPAGAHVPSFFNQPGRSDVFQAFGFPPPGRPSRATALRNHGLGSGFVNPAALTRPQSNHNHAGQATGSGAVSDESAAGPAGIGSSIGTGIAEVPQMKRTMYGTELEGDTRFGDFGVEGVGNTKGSFWAGGRF
ncbi:hypothetical protein LshimejAT787_0305680 [Lyophyllum shimeji]|uniref:Uncharacterized protein n=1 Tax=Lyophyllum shimeji TaxID=47721 RepID=A0A9P3UM27_LYOSH|nr:hypothetical protein LshimejAT787_0305680 [Lyophyllum shimeji]